ncbi:protein kinase [Paecilomyces lecythidis]|uniref:Protein kinase n=1 Tax=Paecilomyces lecythidis TaxID=3004212 RepID=A0ABR3XMQ3_9EURO
MSASEDFTNFDIIEAQKENVQSLPGGRSARALAQIFSSGSSAGKLASPSPNETKTVNDAIRQEYEAELQTIDESDDPLDIYDRYVKWTMNAYPSTQATAESGLLPLLERATKSFLTSSHYKNDPRYLRLWLHYIRLFSDSPREVFAFLARHHIGEGLALFYEEFAAWLEGAGRWTQAEEVYRLGIDREARPTERLLRKFKEFQIRFEHRRADGPSSPALPAVRPALAAKIDPFASAASPSPDPQAQRPSPGASAVSKTKSGKPKMAIFSDANAAPAAAPALGGPTKGWESIGSLHERKKENTMEAKPWAGETLKAGKKAAPAQKMAIFRDQSKSNSRVQEAVKPQEIPEHHVREAVNPRTGRRERVFVDLEAVYPDRRNPSFEISFEELRAIKRGWMDKDWRQKKPLKQISGNASCREPVVADDQENCPNGVLAENVNKLTIKEDRRLSTASRLEEDRDVKAAKAKKIKVKEIKGETQTIKTNLDSPTGPKLKKRNTSEPTMTIHTRAATDEIYSIFNQPLKAETEERADSLCGSDYEDDDYTSAGESTATGVVSAASSEFGDDETSTLQKTQDEEEEEEDDDYDYTRAESVAGSEWTEFSTGRHIPKLSNTHEGDAENTAPHDEEYLSSGEASTGELPSSRSRFVPQMPEDYAPPCGTYRDPAIMAQNRLPFMTPIVERTEYSLPSMTAARNNMYDAKTPSKPMQGSDQASPSMPAVDDLLLSSPVQGLSTPQSRGLASVPEDDSPSPAAKRFRPSPPKKSKKPAHASPIIKDAQCNPTDGSIHATILNAIDPPLTSFAGYYDHSEQEGNHSSDIQKYIKALAKKHKSGDKASFATPVLSFPGAERSYVIRRELGAGAFAPVYLAESTEDPEDSSGSDTEIMKGNNKRALSSHRARKPKHSAYRYGFEAIKMEIGKPNIWEFYMIRISHERLSASVEYARAADSIVRAHELHVFKDESFLVEDYRGQGTLLDLVNMIRNETAMAAGSAEAGLDEALAMFFAIELFRVVEGLHACGVLHGDIKPDNCLVRFDEKADDSSSPSASLLDLDEDFSTDPREIHYSPTGLYGWRNKGLALIDFGRAIDMWAFQPSVQFIADWETGGHECNEIREMRPWTYQIDLYGVAGTIHAMLFGKYIESVANEGRRGSGASNKKSYRLREPLKRYWDRELWTDVFDLLLNPGADRWVQMEKEGTEPTPQGTMRPVLRSMKYVREKMEAWLLANAHQKDLALQIRKLEAVLSKRREKLEK